MLRSILMSSILLVSACGASLAQEASWPKKAYDASYNMTSSAGQSSMRTITDGKGHMRQEANTAGHRSISIMDFPSKTMYVLMPEQNMAMKLTMKLEQMQGVWDEAAAAKLKAKNLGKKVVDGHPCQGWQYTSQGVTSESWVGDDIQCLVSSTTAGPQIGKSTMRLTKYSGSVAKDPSLFSVPPGYKVMSAPMF